MPKIKKNLFFKGFKIVSSVSFLTIGAIAEINVKRARNKYKMGFVKSAA